MKKLKLALSELCKYFSFINFRTFAVQNKKYILLIFLTDMFLSSRKKLLLLKEY